jgi:hypothetical protein
MYVHDLLGYFGRRNGPINSLANINRYDYEPAFKSAINDITWA